jgi:hypothetical protein
LRYSKWLDTFRTALILNYKMLNFFS